MMSTLLGHDRIIAYALDPEGDDDLWQGDPEDLNEEPEQLDLTQTQDLDPTAEPQPPQNSSPPSQELIRPETGHRLPQKDLLRRSTRYQPNGTDGSRAS